MLWRRKRKPQSRGQYWARKPSPIDALAGYAPDLNLVGDDKPAEVYPDEIDPAWADSDSPDDAGSQ